MRITMSEAEKTKSQKSSFGLEVFEGPPRIGATPGVLEIAAMIKGGPKGDMDKKDV
jgi:hypothetical protein